MVTDVPGMVAWYCERTGMWFPITYESMKMHLPSVNYVYFSAREQTGSFREQNIKKEYIDNPIFREDFKLVKELIKYNSNAFLTTVSLKSDCVAGRPSLITRALPQFFIVPSILYYGRSDGLFFHPSSSLFLRR